jgi:hypothetical protein
VVAEPLGDLLVHSHRYQECPLQPTAVIAYLKEELKKLLPSPQQENQLTKNNKESKYTYSFRMHKPQPTDQTRL